ncbi:MAG: IS1634 family transposase [Erysipelotrichaceae bacterium]|nr:IS1634 family transposase [Erysipelotrichaceae bacterium]
MRVTLTKSNVAEHVYISKAYRNDNGKSTSRIFKKLGTMAELLPKHDNDRDKVLAWAREQARICTEAEKNNTLTVPVEFSQGKQIALGEQVSFNGGYLFLQKMFHELGLNKICNNVSKKYEFQYNLSSILANLIYARILSPSSKLSSFEYMQELIETPDFELHHIYRALDVLEKESENIQASIYENTKKSRNDAILYYDCTNFFFEVEEEAGIKKYGKSKEHRPNPIVQLGLFLDGNGIPLAFTVFPGNENEQPTLIPMEEKILSDFSLSKFIICTDAGLASTANRRFNNRADRSFIVTQSLKTMKGFLKEWALDPKGWSLGSGDETYDISKIDEDVHMNSVFHKERWIKENDLEQRLIVSYSPKYKHYQQQIRARQVERAAKIIEKGSAAQTRNPNSPSRFVEEIQLTMDGEVAEKTSRSLDEKRIAEESMYDGFTAVCTTLEDDISDILKVNHRRWEIEESFRIMKSDFKARPVYLQKDERIKAHFLTCFLSLLVYRLLEHKLDERYTVSELIKTLRSMNFFRMDGIGYLPEYTRTEITDALHEEFGFRTDTEIIPEKTMKKIIKTTKK